MTSAKPLNLAISLNLTSSPNHSHSLSARNDNNPAPPLDWHKRWYREFNSSTATAAATTANHSHSSLTNHHQDHHQDREDDQDSISSSESSSSSDPWQEEQASITTSSIKSKSKSKRKWVTCISSWQQQAGGQWKGKGKGEAGSSSSFSNVPRINVSSSPTSQSSGLREQLDHDQSRTSDGRKARLGGMEGERIALGLRDGTVWLLRSNKSNSKGKSRDLSGGAFEQEANGSGGNDVNLPPSSSSISMSPTSTRDRSSRPSRTHSPTPSTHSHTSRQSNRNPSHQKNKESHSHPPFAGFGSPISPTGMASTSLNQIVTDSSEFSSANPPSSSSASISGINSSASGRDTPETSNVNAMAENNQDENHKMKDAESQLEAQYHAGQKEGGMVESMMGALGLGHPTSSTYQGHHHSHSRTETNGTLSPNRTSYSQTKMLKRELSYGERENQGPRIETEGLESGIRRSSHTPSLDRSNLNQLPTLNSPALPQDLNQFSPIFQFFTSDRSQVVGISTLFSDAVPNSEGQEGTGELELEPTILVVLQESGTLTQWSLEDGTLRSTLNLSKLSLYEPEKSSAPTIAVPSTSSGPLATTLAALRRSETPLGGRSRAGSDAGASKTGNQNSSSSNLERISSATRFAQMESIYLKQVKAVEVEELVKDGTTGLLLAFDSLNKRACLLKIERSPRSEKPPTLLKSIQLQHIKPKTNPSAIISSEKLSSRKLEILYLDSSDHVQSISFPLSSEKGSIIDPISDINISSNSNSNHDLNPPTSNNQPPVHSTLNLNGNGNGTSQSQNASPKIQPVILESNSQPSTPSVISTNQRFDFHLPFQRNSQLDKRTAALPVQEVGKIEIKDLGKVAKISRIGKVVGVEFDLENELVWIWSKSRLLVAKLLGDKIEKLAATTLDFSSLLSIKRLSVDGKKAMLQFDDSVRAAGLIKADSIVISEYSQVSQISSVDSSFVSQGDEKGESLWASSRDGKLNIWRTDLETKQPILVYGCSHLGSDSDIDVKRSQEEVSVVSILPLSMERVVVALSSGQLVLSPLLDLTTRRSYRDEIVLKDSDLRSETSSRYNGTISLLQLVSNLRTSSKHIIGGTEEGDVMIWDSTTLKLQADWSLFTSPVTTVIQFGSSDNVVRLHGCLLIISSDGTMSIIGLDGFKFLSMVPGRGGAKGTGARLERVASRADELLLLYDDQKARLWDARSQELRRSVGLEQALNLLEDGKGSWSQYDVDPTMAKREKGSNGVLSVIPSARGLASTTVLADMRRAIEAASKAVNPTSASQTASIRGAPNQSSASEDPLALPPPDAFMTIGRSGIASAGRSKASPAGAKKALSILKPLLSALLPSCSLTSNAQETISRIMGPSQVDSNPTFGTFSSPGFLARAVLSSPDDTWTASTSTTTDLLLSLVAMLGVLSHAQDLEVPATSIITFLLIDLPDVVGEAYQPASLPALASYFMDSNLEIQQAARALFAAALDRLSQTEIDSLCEAWHDSLPSKSNSPEETRPLALSLLGLIAAERYKMLAPTLLKDIASSISLYIDDENRPMHQALAIELCCRGFSTWQHYLDAMEVVRSLFALSTSKESGAIAENRALARQATLQIAADNTPLFMTTLSLDILHARSPAHCSATMRLVAFMVRRKPLILYPNLPRLAEAVVKSLDPTNTAMREAVVQAATVMISELVSAYPSIAFHGKLQRLAVGTHEGAIIMYDLKTATRLYVLEGHRNTLSGLEFATDGRRLVSISLEEGKALIWKVGNSFTGLFNPGTMPRQGGNDPSGAYKAIDFNIGEAGSLSPADALEAVSFEWQNDRSVRLNVGQASMNFNVA